MTRTIKKGMFASFLLVGVGVGLWVLDSIGPDSTGVLGDQLTWPGAFYASHPKLATTRNSQRQLGSDPPLQPQAFRVATNTHAFHSDEANQPEPKQIEAKGPRSLGHHALKTLAWIEENFRSDSVHQASTQERLRVEASIAKVEASVAESEGTAR